MTHEEQQAARRESTCRACRADGADIGVHDHCITHDIDADDCYAKSLVDACGRVGNHYYHDRYPA